MDLGNKLKAFLFFVADVAALYATLFITLLIRYRGEYYGYIGEHITPFTVVFILWVAVFYVAGLYDLRRLRNNIDFVKTLLLCLAINAAIAILLFYSVPSFGIAPKTNLLLFIVIFAILETFWRRFLNRAMTFGGAPNKILMVNGDAIGEEIKKTLLENPQLGYEIMIEIDEKEAYARPARIAEAAAREKVNLIIIPRRLKRESALAAVLYDCFSKGILVSDLVNFYETILRKVPLDDLEEAWFLENIENVGQFYDPLKRALEFVGALVLGIVLLPVEILIALIVKLTSRGPVFIRQERVGRLGRTFMLYKFRSMVALAPDGQAETNGAQWSGKKDPRITAFGGVLRASHLDELPQLVNIIRGDTSFVGPRPERPEIVEKLRKQIPYYEVRLLTLPGVTGWAQINHRADRDLADVKQKLQYDVYYLKNRSLVLDGAIILRTLKSLFVNPE
ncbi:MAG: sugar transferase [Candidatus Pacebacteria bacterium]|nr:sugar transferase [Candidatus Paceibacterota bacterium]